MFAGRLRRCGTSLFSKTQPSTGTYCSAVSGIVGSVSEREDRPRRTAACDSVENDRVVSYETERAGIDFDFE